MQGDLRWQDRARLTNADVMMSDIDVSPMPLPPRRHLRRRAAVSLLQMWFQPNATTWNITSLAPWACEALCRNRQYAATQGYDYQLQTQWTNMKRRTAASWQKVPLLLDALQRARAAGTGRDGLLAYMDADMQIVNPRMSLAELVRPCGTRAELIVATDWNALRAPKDYSIPLNASHEAYSVLRPRSLPPKRCCRKKCHCLINGGFIVMRPKQWAEQLLTNLTNSTMCDVYSERRHLEQDCLLALLKMRKEMPRHHEILEANAEHRPAIGRGGRVCVLPIESVPPMPQHFEVFTRPGLVSSLLLPPDAVVPRAVRRRLPLAVHFLPTILGTGARDTYGSTTKAALAAQLACSRPWLYGNASPSASAAADDTFASSRWLAPFDDGCRRMCAAPECGREDDMLARGSRPSYSRGQRRILRYFETLSQAGRGLTDHRERLPSSPNATT